MKKIWFIVIVASLILAACAPAAQPEATQAPAAGAGEGEKTVIRGLFMKQAGYQESDIEGITAEFEEKNPDIDVQTEYVSYEALHDKIVTAAASKSGAYDVVLIDCIWPAEFASAGFVLDVTDKVSDEMRKDIWPGALEAATYQGKLYGMPWLNDVLYLYYNEEVLNAAGYTEPPKTWTELQEMGQAAVDKGLVKYPFIEYFKQEEGLTIAYAYYLAAFGGKFFDENNMPAFNSPEGLAALQFMVDGMNNGMYNPASLESTYEEVRRTFSQGESLFSVNWTYQLNLSNDPAESQIVGKSKLAVMPGEAETSATINGGMALSIPADSKHPDAAWKYIEYLSSPEVQKRYAKNALPIWISTFTDPEIVALQPELLEVSADQYKYIVNRPLVPFYSETSKIMSRELQAALTGGKSPEQALADAEAEITKIAEQYQ
ncbi:MAG TPA: extracellular solute-binding protein [Anaerolineales bacterium]|nr:extracellular solute-binding protein [Anaerolineales bacterium]